MTSVSIFVIVSVLSLASLQVIGVSPTHWNQNPLVKDISIKNRERFRVLRRKVAADGCPVNLCFAIDGSASVKPKDYNTQKNFINLIASIVSEEAKEMCAVQYSTGTVAITPLISNRLEFLNKVKESEQDFGITNLGAGIGYPILQLRTKPEQSNKIVFLGNGLSNIGAFAPLVSRSFLASGGSITGVTVGFSDFSDLEAVTGGKKNLIRLDSFQQLIDITKVIIYQTCGYTLPKSN